MDNSGFNSCDLTHKAFEGIFKHGEAFYPFKSLAAAKAKYGAGLHNSRAEDPGVIYSQAYFCHRRPGKTAREFDLAWLDLAGLGLPVWCCHAGLNFGTYAQRLRTQIVCLVAAAAAAASRPRRSA
jgi:hypothetical protein